LVSTSDERPDEAVFAVRGLYATGVPAYDETTVFLPLAKAQSFTRAGERASALFVLLKDREQADAVAAALSTPGLSVRTWRELNELLLEAARMSAGYMNIVYLIVLAMVAVVIANTLLMAVFERTREMGILAALGMKSHEILVMFLLEAGMLGLAGIIVGTALGGLGVAYLAQEGIHVGDLASAAGTFQISETIYARWSPPDVAWICTAALSIMLLASLYPAWFAARLQPIEALRSSQ